MPRKVNKPWGGRGGRNGANVDGEDGRRGGKHFFGHDDRSERGQDVHMRTTKTIGGHRPRVSFESSSNWNSKRHLKKNTAAAIKKILDDDCPMTSATNSGHQRDGLTVQLTRFRGSNSRNGEQRRVNQGGQLIWQSQGNQTYKITLPYGQRYDKSFIIDNLKVHMAPDTFVPIKYHTTDTAAIFFVDEEKTANKLKSCDRKVMGSNGFRLGVRVESGFPQYSVDDKMKEAMKAAMAKRYVQETNALDLSCFHHDPDLVDNYFCALSRPSILMAALNIASAAIPNLEALNLSGNALLSFEKFTTITKKFPRLKILYLANNRLRTLVQLNRMKEWQLEDLQLTGNPLCEKYKNRYDDYVSEVRDKFPKLRKLDGVELPPPIGFDLMDEVKLPPSQRMFVPNAKAQEIASQFLQQYFLIYDSDDRQSLLNAYHEQACFSLSLGQQYNSNNKFNDYYPDNRNLKRTDYVTRRKKLLKVGRLQVVSFIASLPKTRHDLTSFTMDIGLVTEGMMLITVSGLFKEPLTKDEPFRYFNRTFIIVPEGSGYCIRNEQLHIMQPTEAQEKQALQTAPLPAATTAAAPGNIEVAGASSSSTLSASVPMSDEVRQQMTILLSQHTNMNLEWSFKCLKEVDWKFDIALAAFQEFFKLGRIPPEAFVK